MDGAFDVLERRIPDVVSTDDLPSSLAAEIDFLAARTEPWAHSSSVDPAIRARALALVGEGSAARSVLAGLDPENLGAGEAIVTAWAVSRAGPAELVEPMLRRLQRIAEPFVVDPVPYGPTSLAIGQMSAACGDLDAAVAELRTAVAVGDQRAPMWGALARIELARALRCAEAVGQRSDGWDVAEGERAVTAARAFLSAGGYRALLDRLDTDLTGSEDGGPTRGLLSPGARWTIGFGLEPPVEVRPSKGLAAVRYLVMHRDRVVTAVELARHIDGESVEPFVELDRSGAAADIGDDVTAAHLRSMLIDDAARSRLSKSIRRTIDNLTDAHRLLAAHLAASISTGNTCRYAPAGSREVVWALGPSS